MDATLEGVKLKIDRAAEHLGELHREVENYLDSRPYEVVSQPRPGENALLVCKVHRLPPMRLSLLLGDFLHNLRSSLDHLAWQLVLANGGTPGRKTAFPILETKDSKPLVIAGGVHADALRVVEDLQPYNSGGPREHPLLVLNKLNNIDKHRRFNLAIPNVSDVAQMDLVTEDGQPVFTMQFPEEVGRDRPMEDGAKVGAIPFDPGPGRQWRVGVFSVVKLQETGEVGPFGSRSVGTVAHELLDHVRDSVVPEFERFFV